MSSRRAFQASLVGDSNARAHAIMAACPTRFACVPDGAQACFRSSARARRSIRPAATATRVLRRPLPVLPGAARARSRQADARWVVAADALRRHPARLSRSEGVQLGQEKGIRAE